jgi:hypothetical protein
VPIKTLKPGDKATFQWRPGYRGPLRDGETVIVLSIEGEEVKVQYQLRLEETLRLEHLYR